MTPADALLSALRERAWKRNSLRHEQRRNLREGVSVSNDRLETWKAYQVAEAQLTMALMAWEESEHISE
jgi:hypothetical protein